MGNRKSVRILRNHPGDPAFKKESKENEQKEFSHRNNVGKFPRIRRHELTD